MYIQNEKTRNMILQKKGKYNYNIYTCFEFKQEYTSKQKLS
jgi:hypothetical protein